MRIAVVALALLGGVLGTFMGFRWNKDAAEVQEYAQAAKSLGVGEELIKEGESRGRASYPLMLALPLGIGAGICAQRGKGKIAGGLCIAAAVIPAMFAAKSLVFTCFLVVAGGLAFTIKPTAVAAVTSQTTQTQLRKAG